MKTYTVKQLAEILETNPETVRRWIRDKKLKSSQESKKEGNVITQAQLNAFLKASPKYLSKFALGLAALSPLSSIVLSAAGGVVAGALAAYFREKGKVHVRTEDFKTYLLDQIKTEEGEIKQKQELIQQMQSEITESMVQIEKYKYLLKNEQLLNETLKLTNEATNEMNVMQNHEEVTEKTGGK